LDFICGALIGLHELRPEVLAELAAFYRHRAEAGDVSAYADLGDLLRHDDLEGAREAYEHAVAGGDTHSLISLGELLSEHGDAKGAERYLREAVAVGDPDLAAQALVRLGSVLGESEPAAAEAALLQAIETRHPTWGPPAMSRLGHLRWRQGDHAGAQAAFAMAIDSGRAGLAASASESLAMMLEEQGDLAGAKAAYQRAAIGEDDHWHPSAFHGLLSLLRNDDDLDGVRALGQAMAQAGRDRAVAESLEAIAELLERRGDIDGARDAYQQAADAGIRFAAHHLERLSPPAEADAEAVDADELPAQFDPRNVLRTGAEVLAQGLPPLPDVLSYRMAIPVAYWTAGQCAVVLFLRFTRTGREQYPVGMQVTYEKGAEGWTAHRHSVGTSFSHDPIASPGDRRHLGRRRMTTGSGARAERITPGHPAAVWTGSASPTVRHIALIQDGREDRRPLDSHFGAWIVCTEGLSPFQVAGYDENGTVLARVG
jgi:tetratricopeptide (TPR) repeat protein